MAIVFMRYKPHIADILTPWYEQKEFTIYTNLCPAPPLKLIHLFLLCCLPSVDGDLVNFDGDALILGWFTTVKDEMPLMLMKAAFFFPGPANPPPTLAHNLWSGEWYGCGARVLCSF